MIRSTLLALTLLCVAALHGHAAELANAGIWRAYGDSSGAGNAMCAVVGNNQAGSIFSSAELRIPSALRLDLTRTSAPISADGPISVTMIFPGGSTRHLSGQSLRGKAEFFLGQDDLAPWMHEFTARGSTMIYVDGSPSEPMVFDLSGTTPTITAMSECTKFYGFTNLPAPFTPGIAAVLERQAPAQTSVPRVTRESCEQTTDPQMRLACYDILANAGAAPNLPSPPENKCLNQEVAKKVMGAFDDLAVFKDRGVEVVDILSLTTSAGDSNTIIACHGSFLLNKGGSINGTLSFRMSVAGDPYTSWRADQ